MDEGPHPDTTVVITGSHSGKPVEPMLGKPWFLRVPQGLQLEQEAQERIDRWRERFDAAMAGGPVLSLADLGSLIKRTEDAINAASNDDEAAPLRVQLSDMKEEFHMRTFFNEAVTRWPARTVPGQVISRAEPTDM